MRLFAFLFFTIFLLTFNSLDAQNYVFGQLTGSPNMITTGWNLNGNATIGDTPGDVDNFLNELILTNAFNNQSGESFTTRPLIYQFAKNGQSNLSIVFGVVVLPMVWLFAF